MKKCIMEIFQNEKDMLDELFYAREDELADLEKEINKLLLEENIDINKEYNELYELLNKVQPLDVLDKFNQYFEKRNYVDSLWRERYYKEGVKDGICLILECINRKWELNFKLKKFIKYIIKNILVLYWQN